MSPIISVILPTYARYRTGHLKRAIDSYLDQDKDFQSELLIYDDGSIDGTYEYLMKAESCHNDIKLYRSDINTGLPALSTFDALKHSEGKIITWLLDDCVLDKSYLQKIAQPILDNKCSVCYGKTRSIFDNSEMIIGQEYDHELIKIRNIIPAGSIAVDKKIFHKYGWFDTSIIMRRICDHDMWLRINEKFYFIDEILTTEEGAGLSNSLGHTSSLDPEIIKNYYEYRENNFVKPISLSIFDRDFFESLEIDMKERYIFLVIEFLIITNNVSFNEEIMDIIRKNHLFQEALYNYDINNDLQQQHLLRCYSFMLKQKNNEMGKMILDMRHALDNLEK